MEVFIEVWVENHVTGEKNKCNEAIYTFVAVDQTQCPVLTDGTANVEHVMLPLSISENYRI